jgi:hypothetical protein
MVAEAGLLEEGGQRRQRASGHTLLAQDTRQVLAWGLRCSPTELSFGEHLFHASVGGDDRSPRIRGIPQRLQRRLDHVPGDLDVVLRTRHRGCGRLGSRRTPTDFTASTSLGAAESQVADEQQPRRHDAYDGETDDRPRDPCRHGGILVWVDDEHLGREGATLRHSHPLGVLRRARCSGAVVRRAVRRLATGERDHTDQRRHRHRDGNGSRAHGMHRPARIFGEGAGERQAPVDRRYGDRSVTERG